MALPVSRKRQATEPPAFSIFPRPGVKRVSLLIPVLLDNPVLSHVDIIPKLGYCINFTVSICTSFPYVRTSTGNIAFRPSGIVATTIDSPVFFAVRLSPCAISATSLKYLQKYWYLLTGFCVLPILSAS